MANLTDKLAPSGVPTKAELDAALVGYATAAQAAPSESPVFTGTPTAPTAALGTNTEQTATTAFVLANVNGGDITRSAPIDMADNVLQRAEIKDYSESVVAMAASDIDLSAGNVHTVAISGSVTLTFSNPPVSGKAGSFTLICTMSGSPAIAWPAGVAWSAATAPTLSTAGKDIFTFMTTDGGATWYGFTAAQEMS